MGKIHVGTCSWTDQTLIDSETFYPKRSMTAEERLRYYAKNFSTVEVDSTYYALPSEKVVALQTQRTPDDFILNYKAFGMMTMHNVDPSRLPRAVKDMLPISLLAERFIGPQQMPVEARELVWKMFTMALRPAHDAGKLGLIVFQFPPYFNFRQDNFDYILECSERLPEYRVSVEFRHPSWVSDENIQTTMDFLRDNNLVYVCVDEPQFDDLSTMPPVSEATSDVSYIRFHGRNANTWRAKGITTAERFAYSYNDDELREWLPKILKLAELSKDTFAMMNNCFQDYAIKNATRLMGMLGKI